MGQREKHQGAVDTGCSESLRHFWKESQEKTVEGKIFEEVITEVFQGLRKKVSP